MENRVAILMAVYNGMKFLPEMLSSLQEQTYKNWTLYIQDDLSTDDTVKFLEEKSLEDDRIQVVPNDKKLGAMGNFMSLLNTVDAPYYMFCDQDDVWLPNKIELSLNLIKQKEQEFGSETPIIVHTDLKVVDRHLQEIAPSFWKLSRIDPNLLVSFNEQAGHNLVTGCTMLFNQSVKKVSQHYNQNVLMHDVWVLLCALKNAGKVFAIDTPTILYRQHGNNTLGARDISKNYVLGRLLKIRNVVSENILTYRMFQSIGYGSIFKYLYYKIRYFVLYKSR